MYTLIAENSKGEKLTLTNNLAYTIVSVEGLYPPEATINMSETAGMDGAKFKSSRNNKRNIVITLAIESPAEENRINLYKYFQSKRFVRIYYKNGMRDVYTDGYVETMPVQMFEMKQMAQISILCPESHFKDTNQTIVDFSSTTPMFEFPFAIEETGIEFSQLKLGVEKSIVNNGDVPTGTIITLTAIGLVLNPKVFNTGTNESFILDMEMAAGDVITINTNAGSKRITLLRDGKENNIINTLRNGSNWFELEPGDNVFTYTADEFAANLSCQFEVNNRYGGV